jgi:PAS domain S-box-containing protein
MAAVPVALHCHSSLSDGTLAPEALASTLSAQGARYAALTDHDTVKGLGRFRQALARLGVGAIDGIEIAVSTQRGEVHLLAYGIDPEDPKLLSFLHEVRRRGDPGVHGLVDSLRRLRPRPATAGTPPGPPASSEAIRVLHAARGLVFLAHPLTYGLAGPEVESLVAELKHEGLDGLEAIYADYPAAEQEALEELAARLGLAVSAGSDFHGPGGPGPRSAVQELPREQWEAFRARLFAAAGHRGGGEQAAAATASAGGQAARRLRAGGFAARIAFPTAVAIALFLAAIFAVIIPAFERSLLDRKKDMIRELTNSAVSILGEYAADEVAGRLSRAEAQAAAAARIRDLRYGAEGKDYFWITDMRPVMIMHPWRPDLEGGDVSGYSDANGVRVFVEFVNAVRDRDAGYVEYLWQWKDDSHRIVPKLSFVKRFAPWDWVVGTGIYIEDVNAEIAGIASRIVRLSVLIAVLMSLLLLFVAQQSLAIERGRRRAEAGLRESHERYRALVEASSEGMLVVVDGACTYANGTFQDMVGFAGEELALLEIAELVRAHPGAEPAVCRFLGSLSGNRATPEPGSCECLVMGRGGRLVDALLSASRFDVAGRKGAIVTVKDLGARRRAGAAADPFLSRELWEQAGTGLFRASAGRRAALLEANPGARAILGIAAADDPAQTSLFASFADPGQAESVQAELTATGVVRDREVRLKAAGGSERIVRLTAVVEAGEPRSVAGLLEDVTAIRLAALRSQELVGELETSTLRLSSPAAAIATPAQACAMETPVGEAAERMSRSGHDVLVVTTAEGDPIGIVTDRDIRERFVAGGLDRSRPVRDIMSAPLVRLGAEASVFDAITALRKRGVGHLAVTDASGRVAGIVGSRDILRNQAGSPEVLRREIMGAQFVDELARCRDRLVALAGSLAAVLPPRGVNRLFSSLSDVVVHRLADLATAGLGPAPVPFAFVALGSEGREEMVPGSDQDNALVYVTPVLSGTGAKDPGPYFLALGERVCSGLDSLGIPYCNGGVMAKNPRWCAPLQTWCGYFERWIAEPEPQEVLDFNIFFDLRCIAGDAALVAGLRAHINGLVAEHPAFLGHLARDAVQRKLPSPRGTGVDLKEAMAPIIGFARLYALKHGIAATNTLQRLDGLRDAGVLAPASYEAVANAYTLMMRLRLLRGPGGTVVDPATLNRDDEASLRTALTELVIVRKKIAFDFPAAAL